MTDREGHHCVHRPPTKRDMKRGKSRHKHQSQVLTNLKRQRKKPRSLGYKNVDDYEKGLGVVSRLLAKKNRGSDTTKGNQLMEITLKGIKELMPDLFKELREDHKRSPLVRNLIVLPRSGLVYNSLEPFFEYQGDRFPDVYGSFQVLQNYGLVSGTCTEGIGRYVMSEKLAQYLNF